MPPSSSPPPDSSGKVYGHQRPRIFTAPPHEVSTAGQEAVDLAKRAGLDLDPWQQWILHRAMGEKADGSWNATEVAVNVPRQNGKGGVIEARVLWGLFIGGEKQILVSAHEFKTTQNTMKRIERLIRACPDLHKRVKHYHKTVGREGIELHDGREVKYIARSRGSGRGFTSDCVIFDECMILGDDAMSALAPTSDAVENSQLWYLGSAGIGAASQQLGRLRRRAVLATGKDGVPDPVMAYMEWSIDPHVDECTTGCDQHDAVDSVEALLRANPAVGYRLQVEKSMQRRLTMGDALYARERLGVGEYPADREDTWKVIPEESWRALADAEANPGNPVAFAIDATPERSHAAICAAGAWGESRAVEVVAHQPGMGWVVEKARNLQVKWSPCAWVVDPGGPAGSLIPELEREWTDDDGVEHDGLVIVQPKAREVAAAAGQFYDAVAEQTLQHRDEPPMASALAGAEKRPLGDAWAWARRGVSVDISPLVAATNALWGLAQHGDDVEEDPLDNIW